jgi:hypothetical protein
MRGSRQPARRRAAGPIRDLTRAPTRPPPASRASLPARAPPVRSEAPRDGAVDIARGGGGGAGPRGVSRLPVPRRKGQMLPGLVGFAARVPVSFHSSRQPTPASGRRFAEPGGLSLV